MKQNLIKQNLITIKNLKKSFGGINALDNCSLEIKKNKITAIIGPNGSGKSTLFHAISHLISADSGEIYLDENEISPNMPDYWIASLGIARTFQDARLFRNLTIQDHLEIALSQNDDSLLKSLFGKKENFDEKIKEILHLVGLNKPLNTLATDLSYGQRKLLDLAAAIAKPHSIMLLDEPVAGVNPVLRNEIKHILKELHKKGETIVIIEHDMNFIMDLVDYIYVFDYGAVIAEGIPKEIQDNKKVLEAYLGD
ncbi:ABC transporter ATP-binding protein [Candidatus Woesearchaeota archaeon]|nr:ABC transporter ATP-binding protein [Candidatus Woesearchaeota archaeon]